MEGSNSAQVLDLMERLNGDAARYLKQYLANAPVSILEAFSIISLEKNETFIFEGKQLEVVYILVDGIVKAIDYYKDGVSLEYMRFQAVKTFGTMELLLDFDTFKTTLTTVTSCTFLVIPKSVFLKWFQLDANALMLEARVMTRYLLDQAKSARNFLFLEGKQRVIVFIVESYRYKNQSHFLKLTQKSIADCTGLSLRTVNRIMRELIRDGYVNMPGKGGLVTERQLDKLEELALSYYDEIGQWNNLQ